MGYVAADDQTLVVTLEKPTSYFPTMLTYSCFLPICEDWYLSHGGVFGVEEYAAASADTNTYTFGMNTDVASQVYCGPYLLQKLVADSEIVVVKNHGIFAHGTPKEILTVDMLAEVFGVKADIFVNSQGISVLSPVSLVGEERGGGRA